MPPDVSEILDAMEQTWQSLDGVLTQLSPEDWHRPTGCPGWDVQDNVSHIIGLERRFGLGELEGYEDTGNPADAERIMQPAVDARRSRAPEEVLEEFRSVTTESLARRRAASIPPDFEAEGPFGWRLPYWRLLSIRVFDCYAHEQDVRRAVGRPGNLEGPAADVTRRQISFRLGQVLPARVPELSTQTIDIDLGADTIRIGGEAADAATTGPAATIQMDFSTLVALACGRADARTGGTARNNPDPVTVYGDVELADRVLDAMGFTP